MKFSIQALIVVALIPAGLAGCGGRTGLVVVPQIGQLSDHAVIGNDAGIRMIVHSNAWEGPPLDQRGVVAMRITMDNDSPRSLRLRHGEFALVFSGRRQPALALSTLPLGDMVRNALPERTLPPSGRITGFVYFERPADPGSTLDLVATLADAFTAETFGAIQVTFRME